MSEELTPWQKYKKNLGSTRPWHIITEEKVPENILSERLSICYSCPKIINLTKQCTLCGCIMTLKGQLADAECPIGKWGKFVK